MTLGPTVLGHPRTGPNRQLTRVPERRRAASSGAAMEPVAARRNLAGAPRSAR